MQQQLVESLNELNQLNPAKIKHKHKSPFWKVKIFHLTKRLLINNIINDIGIRHTVDKHVVNA
jgi:hypothetical protein